MAHMSFVDIPADKPSHCSAHKDVGSKMLLRGDARRTNHRGEAVGNNANHRLVLVLVADQRRDGPYLNGVPRRKGAAPGPKFAGFFPIGAVASEDRFQNTRDDQRIEQSIRAEDPDLAGLGVVGDNAESVVAGDQWNQRIGGTDLRDPPTPFHLAVAVLQSIGYVVIGGDKPRSDGAGQQPPLRVAAIHAKRTGEDVLLVEKNVEEKLAPQGLEAFRVAGVEDSVALVGCGRLRLRMGWRGGWFGRRLTRGLPASERGLASLNSAVVRAFLP